MAWYDTVSNWLGTLGDVTQSVGQIAAPFISYYNTQQYKDALDQWNQAQQQGIQQGQQQIGQTLESVKPFSDLAYSGLNQAYGWLMDPSKYVQSPGFEWKVGEGMGAIEKTAAARGRLQSGGTLRELSKYYAGAQAQDYDQQIQNMMNLGYFANLPTLASLSGDLASLGVYGGRVGGATDLAQQYANQGLLNDLFGLSQAGAAGGTGAGGTGVGLGSIGTGLSGLAKLSSTLGGLFGGGDAAIAAISEGGSAIAPSTLELLSQQGAGAGAGAAAPSIYSAFNPTTSLGALEDYYGGLYNMMPSSGGLAASGPGAAGGLASLGVGPATAEAMPAMEAFYSAEAPSLTGGGGIMSAIAPYAIPLAAFFGGIGLVNMLQGETSLDVRNQNLARLSSIEQEMTSRGISMNNPQMILETYGASSPEWQLANEYINIRNELNPSAPEKLTSTGYTIPSDLPFQSIFETEGTGHISPQMPPSGLKEMFDQNPEYIKDEIDYWKSRGVTLKVPGITSTRTWDELIAEEEVMNAAIQASRPQRTSLQSLRYQ